MMTSAQKSASDILGLEFDWLASDQNEHVALFSTGGAGYAPAEFLQDTEAHDAAIDAILSLPASTEVMFSPTLAANLVNTWKLVAERGLYAFDCDPNVGTYVLVAAPCVPIRVCDLPPEAVDVVVRIKLCLSFDVHKFMTNELLRGNW